MKQMIMKDSACLKDTRGKLLEISGDPQVSKRDKKIKSSLETAWKRLHSFSTRGKPQTRNPPGGVVDRPQQTVTAGFCFLTHPNWQSVQRIRKELNIFHYECPKALEKQRILMQTPKTKP